MSAVFNILLKVNPGAAKAGIKDLENALAGLTNAAAKTAGVIAGIAAVFKVKDAIGTILSLANAYTEIQNKLRVVTTGTENLNAVSKETLQIALETRTAWAETVTMFSRISQNAKELGVGQRQILDFTRQLNMAVVVSGATSQEANAALIQLSQGMASGTLRGDELRSVMEQLPIVADVIAKKAGVTRGELRNLGKQGKITSEMIIEAFRESAAELEGKFGKTIPTLDQSLQGFNDTATATVGKLDQVTGASRALSAIVKITGQELKIVGDFLSDILEDTDLGRVAGAITEMENRAANAERIKKLTAALDDQDTKAKDLSQTLQRLKDAGADMSDYPYDANIASTLGKINELWNDSFGLKAPMAFKKTIEHLREVEKAYDKLVEKHHGKEVAKEAELLYESLQGTNDILEDQSNKWDKIIDRVRQMREIVGKPKDGQAAASSGRGMTINPNDPAGVFLNAPVDEFGMKVPNMSTGPTSVNLGAPEASGVALRGTQVKGVDLHEIQIDLAEDEDKLNFRLKEHGKLAAEVKKHTRDLAYGQKALGDLYKDGTITLAEYNREMEKYRKHGKKDNTRDQLEAELNSLMKKSNPIVEAETNLARASQTLMRSLLMDIQYLNAEGEKVPLTWGKAGEIFTNYARELEDALHPMEAFERSIAAQRAAMHGSIEEMKTEEEITAATNSLREKGLDLTDSQTQHIRELITAKREQEKQFREEQQFIEQITKPYETYLNKLRAIDTLKREGRITGAQGQAAFTKTTQEFEGINDKAYEEFLDRQKKLNPVKNGLVEGLEKFKTETIDTSDEILKAMTGSIDALDKFILTAAESGKFAFKDMVDSILHELSILSIELLKAAALRALISGFGGTQSVFGTGATQAFSGLYGGAHADGGHYTVPGSGAPDSRRVMFDLTPGERVDFTPPGQNRAQAAIPPQYRAPRIVIQNVLDRRELVQSMRGNEGQQTIYNQIRKNPTAFKNAMKGS